MPSTKDEELKPKFLDIIENGYASEINPTRTGVYIRDVYRRGKLNPGKYMILTDRTGKLQWEVGYENERLKVIGNLLDEHSVKEPKCF